MVKMDFKRKLPEKMNKLKNVTVVKTSKKQNIPRETNESQPTENKEKNNTSSWRVFSSVILGSATIISICLGFYLYGYGNGEKAAEDAYPDKYEALQISFKNATEKNTELAAEKKALLSEVDILKSNLEKLRSASKESTLNNTNDEIITSNNVFPESKLIGESESGEYFESELFISVLSVDSQLGTPETVSITVSALNSPTKNYNDLTVGSKVKYETSEHQYEVLITNIDYVDDVNILVNKN